MFVFICFVWLCFVLGLFGFGFLFVCLVVGFLVWVWGWVFCFVFFFGGGAGGGVGCFFESGYKFCVPLDANVSVEVVGTRKSNTIRNFPCTALQCPVVLTSLKQALCISGTDLGPYAPQGSTSLLHCRAYP